MTCSGTHDGCFILLFFCSSRNESPLIMTEEKQCSCIKTNTDNKGVITNIFSHHKPGISLYLQTNADLVMAAHHLVSIIPITISAHWVKGQYHPEFQHDLNDKADYLATGFNRAPHPDYRPTPMPQPPPNFGIHLLYNNSVITKLPYHGTNNTTSEGNYLLISIKENQMVHPHFSTHALGST